jgi:5-formyltetrahydrofolate cyclo-ligase
LDLDPVVNRIWAMGKCCYLPVLCDRPDLTLRFAPYQPDSCMRTNSFGIDEPDIPHRSLLSVHDLDLLLMPLVAFDSQGNRLGMGGGYFDRTLAFRNQSDGSLRPHLLGVAFAFQQVAAVPTEAWDIPLDSIVTDHGVLTIT